MTMMWPYNQTEGVNPDDRRKSFKDSASYAKGDEWFNEIFWSESNSKNLVLLENHFSNASQPCSFLHLYHSSIQPSIASCIASLLTSFASFFIPKPSNGEIEMDAMVIFFIFLPFLPHSSVIVLLLGCDCVRIGIKQVDAILVAAGIIAYTFLP